MTQNEKLNLARDNAWAAYDRLEKGYREAADAERDACNARRQLQSLEDAYFAAADAADAAASDARPYTTRAQRICAEYYTTYMREYDESVKQK